MTNPWKKASEAFRTRMQEIKHKIHQSKPIQWLLKQKWFRWMTGHQAAILTILAITAFASYAFSHPKRANGWREPGQYQVCR